MARKAYPSARLCENSLRSFTIVDLLSPAYAGGLLWAIAKGCHAPSGCCCPLSLMTTLLRSIQDVSLRPLSTAWLATAAAFDTRNPQPLAVPPSSLAPYSRSLATATGIGAAPAVAAHTQRIATWRSSGASGHCPPTVKRLRTCARTIPPPASPCCGPFPSCGRQGAC